METLIAGYILIEVIIGLFAALASCIVFTVILAINDSRRK